MWPRPAIDQAGIPYDNTDDHEVDDETLVRDDDRDGGGDDDDDDDDDAEHPR